MPHKAAFQVVECSCSDDGYSGKDLEVHSPTTCGWQSARFCAYPQKIVLKLREPMRIRKLQILSHQCLIATKIEIFVSKSQSRERRLGYVALSSNENNAFKARELKSIHLDADGQFIKLLLHKNHVNRYNIYNQVNLVAVNVIADRIDEPSENEQMANLLDKFVGQRNDPLVGNADRANIHISPMDDIAFDLYQDQETATMIRRLEQKKQEAIREERYDFAKRLKEVIADLYKVGERLGRYEVEKKRAIEQEDYDLAMVKKDESEKFRLYVYNQLNLQQLLDINPSKTISIPQAAKEKTPTPQILSPVLPPIPAENDPVAPHHHTPLQSTHMPSPLVEETPPDVTKQDDFEERPLPALSKKSQKEELPEEEGDIPQGEVEELKEKDAREAAQFIEVFGEHLAKCLFSKQWKYRQECIDTVKTEIGRSEPDITAEHEPKAVIQAVIFALKKVIKDPVFSVYNKSLQLLRDLLRKYIPNTRSGKGELTHAVDSTVPVLITRTGDMAARTRDIAMDMILEIAVYPELKSSDVIPYLATRQFKTKAQKTVRLYRSRLELIEKLMAVLEIKTGQGGWTTENIMNFAVPALSHTNGEVRDAAVKVILELYKKVKAPVKKYLPADDATTRKNPLYKHIFDEFDRIDGKPTEAERKAMAKNNSEKEKQEQIAALQAQLQALKDMAAQHGVKNENAEDKTTKKAPAKRKSKVEEPVRSPPPVANVDKMCIFCGEQNDNFTEEMLDLHYWKSCPVLIRCTHCSHVVEISGLNDHYLSECDKDKFGQCTRCKEAFLLADLDDHMRQKTCTIVKGDKPNNICPLCRTTIGEGDEAWKEHLMETCQANKKRIEQQQQSSKAPSMASLRSVGKTTPSGVNRKGAAAASKPRGRGKAAVAR